MNTEMGIGPFFFVATIANQIIIDLLEQHGYELIEAEFVKSRGLWRVFIDRPDSRTGVDRVGIEDCTAVTELLLDEFERAGVVYEQLEVSTPGMDRALTRLEHFRRFAGQKVRLSFEVPYEGRRKLSGVLIGEERGHVLLRVEDEIKQVPFSAISRARIVPTFEEL